MELEQQMRTREKNYKQEVELHKMRGTTAAWMSKEDVDMGLLPNTTPI